MRVTPKSVAVTFAVGWLALSCDLYSRHVRNDMTAFCKIREHKRCVGGFCACRCHH